MHPNETTLSSGSGKRKWHKNCGMHAKIDITNVFLPSNFYFLLSFRCGNEVYRFSLNCFLPEYFLSDTRILSRSSDTTLFAP